MPTNATLVNGLRLLAEINATEGELGVTELARRLKLAPSQIHRLLGTLVEQGFCQRDPDRRRYRAGLRTLELAHTYLEHDPLRRRVLPVLQDLAQATGCDAFCCVPDGTAAIVVATAWPGGRQRSRDASLGRRFGSETASLRMLAAAGRVPGDGPEEAGYELTSLTQAAADGMACKRRDGSLHTAAAPVREAIGVVAVLSVWVPVDRVDNEAGILERLRQAAAIVSPV